MGFAEHNYVRSISGGALLARQTRNVNRQDRESPRKLLLLLMRYHNTSVSSAGGEDLGRRALGSGRPKGYCASTFGRVVVHPFDRRGIGHERAKQRHESDFGSERRPGANRPETSWRRDSLPGEAWGRL